MIDLANLEEGEMDAPAPPRGQPSAAGQPWFPSLNPTQWKIWDDPAPYLLAYGEKGSGKTIVAGHKLVRHCYENDNAMAVIVTPSIRTGNEGVLHDLVDLVLPAWRDGNRYPNYLPNGAAHPHAGKLMDTGIGLEFTQPKLDPQTKDRHLWIRNMHGGWSKVLVISIPYEEAIGARIKAVSPSMVYIDELTDCNGPKYFTFTAAQLTRRRGITGPQQWIATCNPEGPSHWVYRKFFIECVKGGQRDPKYSVYHVPVVENMHRLPADYRANLESLFTDPVERARLLDGEWMDRPSGEALFKDHFIPNIHVIGDRVTGAGILPTRGHPIIIGYDPGPVNFSIHFLQLITRKSLLCWSVFDELNYVGKRTLYERIAADLCATMDYWREVMAHEFSFEHISDEAAFTTINSTGSFEARDFERMVSAHRLKVPGPTVRIRPCPKGNDSVPARVRTVQTLLLSEQLYVSATCIKTIEMLTQINAQKNDPNKSDPLTGFRPDSRSPYRHSLDSMSYPIFYYANKGSGPQAGKTRERDEGVYFAGARR